MKAKPQAVAAAKGKAAPVEKVALHSCNEIRDLALYFTCQM